MKRSFFLVASLAVWAAPCCRAQSGGLATGTLGPPMPGRLPAVSAVARGDSSAGRQTISDLPVHWVQPGEDDALKGPMEWIKGEKLQWGYSFPWTGRGADGRPVPLTRGDLVTFLSLAGGSLRLASANSPDFTVQPPPNVALEKILHFARLKLADCSDAILENRIGQPTSVETPRQGAVPGEKILLYEAPEIRGAYTRYKPILITVPDWKAGGTKQVETSVTRTMRTKYTPYSFEVHCDASGKVIGVHDFVPNQTVAFH